MKTLILSIYLLCCLSGTSLHAILLSMESLETSVPSGSNSPTAPYTDDLLLDAITFDGHTFEASADQMIGVESLYVVSGRGSINAEWGDDDDGSDGNPTPFERFGLDPNNQEVPDETFQDLGLASAFSSRSLTEGSDGEGAGENPVFRVIFGSGVVDNDSAADLVPEIVLFERGNNDSTTVRAIVGGTFLNPVYAPLTVSINAGDMTNTGLSINTTEINSAQELAVVGIDLNDFGTTNTVFGLEIATNGGDFSGIFGTILDPGAQTDQSVPDDLNNPAGTIPELASWPLLMGLCSLAFVGCRRRVRC